MLPTIAWQEEDIVMVDQRKLPAAEIYVTCRTVNDVAKAIKTMVIRGAPAIGVCAAMGLALGAARSKATGGRSARSWAATTPASGAWRTPCSWTRRRWTPPCRRRTCGPGGT